MKNPLLQKTKFPLFESIKPLHMASAIKAILKENQKILTTLIRKCQLQKETLLWANLIAPLEDMNDRLHNAWGIISHLNAVKNTPQIRKVYTSLLPAISKYFIALGQNEDLYNAILILNKNRKHLNLNATQQKILSEMLRDFRLSGVALLPSAREQFAKVQLELNQLGNKFSNNVLDSTQSWQYCAKANEIEGIPEHALAVAKERAKQAHKTGFLFSLDMPSYYAVMTFAASRSLREKFYRAYVTRASVEQNIHAKKYNNSNVIVDILQRRTKLAQHLKFKNFAEYSLATKVAPTTSNVVQFLTNLSTHALPKGKAELEELSAYAKTNCGIPALKPWDTAYCSEKLRLTKYQLSDEKLREYFPLAHVLKGLFAIVSKLFALEIKEVAANKFEKWHKDVRLFAIYARPFPAAKKTKKVQDSAELQLRGYFYIDLFARLGKRGGAWLDECRVRHIAQDGSLQLPISYLNCNFTVPTKNRPPLLAHHEVITLFHEFGHCLQHLLSQIDYAHASSLNNIPLDTVEFASQFLENWCWNLKSLKMLSHHYRTGEELPNNLIARMVQNKNFQSGLQTLRQLEFGLCDFRWHLKTDIHNYKTVQKIVDYVRRHVRLIKAMPYDRFANSFDHVFGGSGYAAGYYSYKWSEMMAQDAFELFRKRGIFNVACGVSYRKNILEVGSAISSLTAFKNFRGRAPKINALLKEAGFNKR